MWLFRKYCSPSRLRNAGKKKKKEQPAAFSALPSVSAAATTISPQLLSIILSRICPHVLDESYDSSEESTAEDGCMLCNMRDLAHCALVSKAWCMSAQTLLYQHVRIDAVHYCELEIELSSKRKRHRSTVSIDGKKLDVPQTRLQLFMRTIRESQQLADLVLSLRLPYMTREASKSDLARTVSVLRCLRYVDLPVGFFSDDLSSYTLKQELMANCPDIRRMAYTHGSEMSLSQIPGSNLWVNLESLELSELLVEESTLLQVLNSFPALRTFKMESLPSIGDSIFAPTRQTPIFPPIASLNIRKCPAITADGLAAYLSMSQNQHALEELVLVQSGVRPESLHMILSRASNLKSLTLELDVNESFPSREIPPLASTSVNTIHYEIISTSSPPEKRAVISSYYHYLMSSLNSNSLPALRRLYVLDSRFADMLLLNPPSHLSSRHGLQKPLTLYTKGMDEFEWNITQYEPLSSDNRISTTRPVSFHSAQLSSQWRGEARRSVVVGNGFGGFLAVPVEDGKPANSGDGKFNKRDSKYDLWR